MKARELRDLAQDELRRKEEELRDQLFKLRFQRTLGQLEDKMKIRNVRRDIARIKTVIREVEKGKS
ncbi:MAG: 50S ribosomal protein L29 [Candidatus Aminicenantales bacterium]